jgi:hypothetical protein
MPTTLLGIGRVAMDTGSAPVAPAILQSSARLTMAAISLAASRQDQAAREAITNGADDFAALAATLRS